MDYKNVNWDEAVNEQLADYEKRKTVGTFEKREVDLTKYFTLQLPKGQNSGERKFRVLPLSSENPKDWYEIVRFHNLKVGQKWVKLYDPAQDGDESPLNDVYQLLIKGDKDDKIQASTYKSRDFFIVRGIERGKEAEGVKFWRFPLPKDGSGIMDKIKPFMTHLNEKNPGSGAFWRPDEKGRDLIITLVLDAAKGFTKVSQIMFDDPSPISANTNQATEWMNDTTTWKDMYRKKPIEYLRVVAEGSEPVWDSEKKCFVAKTDDENPAVYTAPVETKTYKEPTTTDEVTVDTETEPVSVDDLPF